MTAKTTAERTRLSRERRGVQLLGLPKEAMDALRTIRERDGDPSNVAAATRVLVKEAKRKRSSSQSQNPEASRA